ncbi:MAG: ABC transporter ATP-binding protein [Thermomicrobia bacterium]|nr:ABC transporter ATP-binding protein [Thermomicrobia bacterium]
MAMVAERTAMVNDGQGEEQTATQEVVLRVTGLRKRYGARVAVQGLDLAVRRGEVFGFLGPNGAGKTTAIAMILRLVAPDAGRVEILGHDVSHDAEVALRRVGAIVETPAYYPYLSGLDNLRVFALARGGVTEERIAKVLALVGLRGRERDRYSAYSLGMKQRLGIAGALLNNPDLLILDEPTNGLDPAGIIEIRQLIRRLADGGQTIVLCSHLLGEVQQVCDRVAIMAAGRIVAQGTVETLLREGAVTVLRVDDPGRAEAILRGVPWVAGVTRQDDALLVDMPEGEAFMLGRVMAEHGIVIGELRRQERDLEQFFLAITNDNATVA